MQELGKESQAGWPEAHDLTDLQALTQSPQILGLFGHVSMDERVSNLRGKHAQYEITPIVAIASRPRSDAACTAHHPNRGLLQELAPFPWARENGGTATVSWPP